MRPHKWKERKGMMGKVESVTTVVYAIVKGLERDCVIVNRKRSRI